MNRNVVQPILVLTVPSYVAVETVRYVTVLPETVNVSRDGLVHSVIKNVRMVSLVPTVLSHALIVRTGAFVIAL